MTGSKTKPANSQEKDMVLRCTVTFDDIEHLTTVEIRAVGLWLERQGTWLRDHPGECSALTTLRLWTERKSRE